MCIACLALMLREEEEKKNLLSFFHGMGFNSLEMNERTSDSSSRLYLIIRKSTVFTAERHHDHFAEKWYGCKEKTRSSLLKKKKKAKPMVEYRVLVCTIPPYKIIK